MENRVLGMGLRRGFGVYLSGLAGAVLATAAVQMIHTPDHAPARKRPNGKVERGSIKISSGAMPVPGGGARERARRRQQIDASNVHGLIGWRECWMRGGSWRQLVPADVALVFQKAGI